METNAFTYEKGKLYELNISKTKTRDDSQLLKNYPTNASKTSK